MYVYVVSGLTRPELDKLASLIAEAGQGTVEAKRNRPVREQAQILTIQLQSRTVFCATRYEANGGNNVLVPFLTTNADVISPR